MSAPDDIGRHAFAILAAVTAVPLASVIYRYWPSWRLLRFQLTFGLLMFCIATVVRVMWWAPAVWVSCAAMLLVVRSLTTDYCGERAWLGAAVLTAVGTAVWELWL